MLLSIYKKFLIYKELMEGESPSSIAKKYNVSRDTIYRIKKESFFKIKDKEKKILDYIEKNPFKSVNDIIKNIKLNKDTVYRTLKRFNVINFKDISSDEIEIVNFLLEKQCFKILNDYLYYNNIEVDPEVIDFSNLKTELKYLKYLKFYHKMLKSIDILEELEEFLKELKNMNFTYLKVLILKIDVLLLKRDFEEAMRIIQSLKNLDNLISISLRAKFYKLYINVLSRLEEFRRSLIVIRKLKRIYKKLPLYEMKEISEFISASYYNWGDLIKALKFSSNDSITQVFILYGLGKYKDVINYKSKFREPHLNYLYTYLKSISYLFMNMPQHAIETMISTYDIKDIVFEDYLERYYTFVITYHKY